MNYRFDNRTLVALQICDYLMLYQFYANYLKIIDRKLRVGRNFKLKTSNVTTCQVKYDVIWQLVTLPIYQKVWSGACDQLSNYQDIILIRLFDFFRMVIGSIWYSPHCRDTKCDFAVLISNHLFVIAFKVSLGILAIYLNNLTTQNRC